MLGDVYCFTHSSVHLFITPCSRYVLGFVLGAGDGYKQEYGVFILLELLLELPGGGRH